MILSQCISLIKLILEFGTQLKNRAEGRKGLTLVSLSKL